MPHEQYSLIETGNYLLPWVFLLRNIILSKIMRRYKINFI